MAVLASQESHVQPSCPHTDPACVQSSHMRCVSSPSQQQLTLAGSCKGPTKALYTGVAKSKSGTLQTETVEGSIDGLQVQLNGICGQSTAPEAIAVTLHCPCMSVKVGEQPMLVPF